MKKKRNRKYRPREVRTPACIFSAYPELPESALVDLDLYGFIPLDAIARGEGTLDNVDLVMGALRNAYTLAAAFEDKAKIRMLCYVATAGLASAAGALVAKSPVTVAHLDPARDVLNLLSDMQRQCDRKTLVQSARATQDNRQSILKIAPGAAHIVDPADRKAWEPLTRRAGITYLNGMARTGYLRWSELMGRLEWVDPNNEVTVAVTGETIVVLAEPLPL